MREIAKHPDLPIVSQWWGSIYDVIYLLKDNHPWYITNDEAKVPNLRGLFVTYKLKLTESAILSTILCIDHVSGCTRN